VWILLLQGIIATLRDVPELLDLLNQMKTNKQIEPTQEQLNALSAAYTERTGADLRWDNFKLPAVTAARRGRPKKD
jgi:hypothetical protein